MSVYRPIGQFERLVVPAVGVPVHEDYRLFKKNKTWWCRIRLRDEKTRESDVLLFSLKTTDVVQARERRDRVVTAIGERYGVMTGESRGARRKESAA